MESPNYVETGPTALQVLGQKVCRKGTSRGDMLLGKSYAFCIAMNEPVLDQYTFGLARMTRKDAAGGALPILRLPHKSRCVLTPNTMHLPPR